MPVCRKSPPKACLSSSSSRTSFRPCARQATYIACRKGASRYRATHASSPAKKFQRPISGSDRMQWLNVIVQGVLIGGLYAMFAAGLSLIFGVMRLVNIAHGDLIVLAAYAALMVTQAVGIDPLTSLILVVPVMALIGYALQRGLLNRTLGDDLLPPLLVTFGLSIIIQNGLLELFTADSRKLQAGAIEVGSIQLGAGFAVGTLPLIQFAVAVGVIAGLQLLFYKTALGR